MFGIAFNPEVSAGAVIQLLFYLVTFVIAFTSLRKDVQTLTTRISSLEESSKSIGALLRDVAVQDRRILNVEEDLRDLKYGRLTVRGLVTPEIKEMK